MKHANMIFQPSTKPLQVGLLVLPESSMMSLASTLDPMRAANRFARRPLFSWSIVTPNGTPATLTCGLDVASAGKLATLGAVDLLIVISGFNQSLHATPTLLHQLRRMAPRLSCLGGVEAGAWVLARAGLLAGQRATTHWEDLEDFAAAHPEIDVRADRFVITPNRITAGGAAPAMDMMLELIRARHGSTLALHVAGVFVYESTADGSDRQPLMARARLERRDPLVARALDLMESALDDPLPINRICQQLGVSRRALETRFLRALNMAPGSTYRGLRLESAARLVRDTAHPIQDIALRCGFSSPAVFNHAFRARFTQSPRQMRARA
ncbi:MAG: GlxA family transcriptional regulator [Paracoccaceae bacterium]